MKKNIPHENGKPVHPISAEALVPVVEQLQSEGQSFNMGMVFPVSTHNYELRYWLAAGGIHPGFYAPHKGDTSGQIDAQALLSVTPPPQMPATMEAGTIHGYCVGEPWNQQAVFKGIGVPVVTDYEIWKDNPEKVFGITKQFAEKYPNTTIRLTRALIRAAMWLDEKDSIAEKNQKIGWYQHGDATEEDKARARVLVLHFEHAAGLNLHTQCHNMVLFSPLYVGEGGASGDPVSDTSTELQAMGRVFRPGQTKQEGDLFRIEVRGPNDEECLDGQLITRNTDEETKSKAINADE